MQAPQSFVGNHPSVDIELQNGERQAQHNVDHYFRTIFDSKWAKSTLSWLKTTSLLWLDWLYIDVEVRARYRQRNSRKSKRIKKRMKRKFISRRSASRKAMKARNDCMEEMRRDSSPLGLLLARIRKREGKSLEQLLDRYSARRYHVPFEKLDKHEKDFASAMLVEGSGRSDIVANRVVACYPFLCSFAVFFAIVASIHTVNKSPDVLKELVHQICSWGLGFAGNKLGDRAGRAVNIGPLIVVICVVIGGYVGANIGNGVVLQWADDDDLTVIV